MANEFNSIGMTLKYCVGTDSTTRPTSGFTAIPNIKSMPDLNGTPATIQVTDLSDSWHRYISGVRDVSGILEFGANLTTDLKTAWNACVKAAQDGAEENKATWFEITIPNFDSFYFAGMPSELGFGGAEVDSVVETSLFISPNQITGFAAAST